MDFRWDLESCGLEQSVAYHLRALSKRLLYIQRLLEIFAILNAPTMIVSGDFSRDNRLFSKIFLNIC